MHDGNAFKEGSASFGSQLERPQSAHRGREGMAAGYMWLYGLAFIVREQREVSYPSIPPLADGLVSLPCRAGLPSSVSLRWK